MLTFWQNVTEPQATIISSLLTIVAAIVGVTLGAKLFGGKVNDLKSALEESSKALTDYKGHVSKELSAIKENFDLQVQAIQQSLGNIGSSVSDIQSSAVPDNVTDNEGNRRSELAEFWGRIRDRLEEIAASPEIDGRTRAKYTRIDRRSYGSFVDALAGDRMLGNDSGKVREALELWQRYRNGRSVPAPADVARMRTLAQDIAG